MGSEMMCESSWTNSHEISAEATIDHRWVSIVDLSPVPDHIALDLFVKTLEAGKLNEKILKLFIASGKDDVLALIKALNIQLDLNPILPTRCSDRF
uniref:Uncharacterized protein n=1 Tax=Kalanchoe fedtschenkoi TaxID=63787 RepID=A0A7N0RBB7_KALFE